MFTVDNASHLQSILGPEYRVLKGAEVDWCLITTPSQIPNGDFISLYYQYDTYILSDIGYCDNECRLFDDDWYKRDEVRAILKCNNIFISETRELSKIVKSNYIQQLENFEKVIKEIIEYIVLTLL
jgi:hypothetical protein